MRKRIAAALLCVLFLSGCGGAADGAADLSSTVRADPVPAAGDLSAETAAAADFGVRLLQTCMEKGGNTLISPLSVLCALGMAAGGAEGETLAQMETVFGIPREDLNACLHAWLSALPDGKQCRLHAANSVWLRDSGGLTVEPGFLQINADWYGAGIFTAPFDGSTCREINRWVKKNTNGIIPEILDEISESEMLYLINALAFEAQWAEIYREDQVREGVFTAEDGTERHVDFMHSGERLYLKDGGAVGFLKPYAGEDYAFAALLPPEGVSPAEYAASLTGERLRDILSGAEETAVSAAIPKFETSYRVELSEALQGMGMTDAFDAGLADFSSMGTYDGGPLYISRILHKTYLAVDEQGTRAGAATAVAMSGGSGAMDIKSVFLNRPFLYLLVERRTNLPVFIGIMADPAQ